MGPKPGEAGFGYCSFSSDFVYLECLYGFGPVWFFERWVQGRIMRTGKHSLQGKK